MPKGRTDRFRIRIDAKLESVVLGYASTHPGLGQARVAHELGKIGILVSPSGVRYIWKRHELETTYKRLRAIEKSSKRVNFTAEQRAVLSRGNSRQKLNRRLERELRSDNGPGSVQRADLILNAAAELFCRHGYDGTSIRDIAKRVGLLPGSVYHHFPSKEDLFVCLNHIGFDNLIDKVEEAANRSSEPWQRLELACAAHIELMIAGNGIDRVTGSSLFSYHEKRLVRRLRGDRDRYESIFARLISELRLLPRVDRSLFRMFVLANLNWTRVWYKPDKKTPSEIAHELIEILRGQNLSLTPNAEIRIENATS